MCGCMIWCCATRFWVAEDGRCFAPRAHLRRCPRLTTSCPCRGKSHPASSPAVVRASFHSPLHRLASPRKISRRAPSRSCRGAWKGDRDASGMPAVVPAVPMLLMSKISRRAPSRSCRGAWKGDRDASGMAAEVRAVPMLLMSKVSRRDNLRLAVG